VWAAALLGCPRSAAPPVTAAPASDVAAPRTITRAVTGPQRVVQASAPQLCVDVPEGWSGVTSDAARFLALEHPDGYAFELTVGTPLAADSPSKPGFSVLFEDAGTYRYPPLLPDAGTRSWTADDPGGPFVRSWYGYVRGVPVEVSVTYPLGGITAGEAVVAPLLERFCAP
jgi:hypothetical protein